MSERLPNLPEDFVFGAGTAGHQVGDNTRGGSNWNIFEWSNASRLADEAGPKKDYGNGPLPEETWKRTAPRAKDVRSYISGRAADWWDGRWQEDLDIAQDLGLKAVRFSIERAQVQPTPDLDFNQEAVNHYKKLIQGCRERGIEPVATLFHFVDPEWMTKGGGWENPDVPADFVSYAKKLVRALDGEVTRFITINEPEVFVLEGWLMGNWPPQKRNAFLKAAKVRKNLIETHNRTHDAIKDIYGDDPTAVSATVNLTDVEAASGKLTDKVGRIVSRKLANGLFLPQMVDNMDFIGMNHYMHNVKKGINPQSGNFQNEGEPRSDLGWYLNPESLYNLLIDLKKYGKPIIITEHGLADEQDQYRPWFIRASLAQVARAIEDGVDVRGYLHWSLIDNFEWDKGKWPRFGLIGVDYETQERTIRESAREYSRIITNH